MQVIVRKKSSRLYTQRERDVEVAAALVYAAERVAELFDSAPGAVQKQHVVATLRNIIVGGHDNAMADMLSRRRLRGSELRQAWIKYQKLFNSTPNGTEKQLSALLELIPARRREEAV